MIFPPPAMPAAAAVASATPAATERAAAGVGPDPRPGDAERGAHGADARR